jgi:uncharacterized glyoxalase superfamily metalloenzyme YdcJ
MSTRFLTTTELRAEFAVTLSALYGTEVPAYNTLLDASHDVNRQVLDRFGAEAERFGTIDRVSAERHGAIRVGSPREMAQVARIFRALGMYACGFYDLRDARPQPIPVVSTAFRPLDRGELATNPFRVFTSMLVPEDRRFFDHNLGHRLKTFLAARELFPPALLTLADRAVEHDGLSASDASEFLTLAASSFALSTDPVDRAWYTELERVSAVAADIGGVTTTHINHLTPRVLDIDELYAEMERRGVRMIDRVQGPPRWDGPDILLRQTSFRALAEPRAFRDASGQVIQGEMRVRFGEVEARGIALTPRGRDLYETMLRVIDRRVDESADDDRAAIAVAVWEEHLPTSEIGLLEQGLAYFTYRLEGSPSGEDVDKLVRSRQEPELLAGLVTSGVLVADPIVYEDFLPRSAAGIFASNLTDGGTMDAAQGGAERTIDWMSGVLGVEVQVPEDVYAKESEESLDHVVAQLVGRR